MDVEYLLKPREPDVGIPCAFGEIENISIAVPVFGNLLISLDDYDTDKVEQAIADEIFEDECNGGYKG